uniref:Integrase catalytic domain-containing protein n=1 Tax=Hippocampus comes TaxID=109280 RepID=A0A3Q2XG39_HIPCM
MAFATETPTATPFYGLGPGLITNLLPSQVVLKLKTVFARFGCPDEVVSDNGPQFSSEEFKEFSKDYDFQHMTSSPHHAQGNGHAERGVQSAKRILQQKDPLLALMSFRSTPSATTGVSPAELLMGRKIKTTLPTLEANLQPKWPDLDTVRERDAAEKKLQALHYNRRHGARPLPDLHPGDRVSTKLDHEKGWTTPAVVSGACDTPRSYLISTEKGTVLRRNRRHLRTGVGFQSETVAEPETVPLDPGMVSSPTRPPDQTLTRSGRVSRPVVKLDL